MKKMVFLPYDFDTAIGINNEGSLAFSYNLEDIDTVDGGADVFNGQKSVLWQNLRKTYFDELKAMYQNLRSTGALSYDKVERMFEEHQNKWPEAIFNEDAFFKYLRPLIDDGSGAYLAMLQGSKAEQRKWWLYNRFRYIDSKYNAGDSLTDVIQLRGYEKADITVVPYADIYPSIKYGSYLVQKRGARGMETTLECPLDSVNDTEIYIYSASQLADIGDLSGLLVGFADLSMATKLQNLKIGDNSEDYINGNLTELTLGNNTLLQTLDARNCTNLGTGAQQTVDISGCTNIEHVYFGGTQITSCVLPNGGILKTLQLPETISNLTIRNQTSLLSIDMPTYNNITTLRLENISPNIDIVSILLSMAANSRVRLIGLSLNFDTETALAEFYNKLDTMRGLDENGNNVDTAQVSGDIYIEAMDGADRDEYMAKYPDLVIHNDHILRYVYCYNYDGSTLLYTIGVVEGENAVTPSIPSRSSTAQYTFTFIGWSDTPNSETTTKNIMNEITTNKNVYAVYTKTVRTYTVYFYNSSSGSNVLLQTINNVPYGGTATYTGSTPVHYDGAEDYEFAGFSPTGVNITGQTNCYARFKDIGISLYKYLRSNMVDYESSTDTIIAPYAFYRQTNLASVTSNATQLGSYCFAEDTKLAKIELTNTDALTLADNIFRNHENLQDVILHTAELPQLPSSGSFGSTKIGCGRGGIFVEDSLLSTYKAGTNWSGYSSMIFPLSSYPREDYCTIEDSWEDIIAAIEDGTYSEKYALGDTKALSINGKIINMQLVGFNKDLMADGSGTATTTWLALHSIGAYKMHSSDNTTINWQTCDLRKYLQEDVYNTLPDVLKNNIKEVTKFTRLKDQTVNSDNETIWLPSAEEVIVSGYENSGINYRGYLTGEKSYRYSLTSVNSIYYWTRTSYANTDSVSFYTTYYSNYFSSSKMSASQNTIIGFCL